MFHTVCSEVVDVPAEKFDGEMVTASALMKCDKHVTCGDRVVLTVTRVDTFGEDHRRIELLGAPAVAPDPNAATAAAPDPNAATVASDPNAATAVPANPSAPTATPAGITIPPLEKKDDDTKFAFSAGLYFAKF